MTLVRKVKSRLGMFPYYVEIYDGYREKWVSQVRYYTSKQDELNYPDSNELRNFKYLGDGKA